MSKQDLHLKLQAAAASRLKKLSVLKCFDPANLDSRPTKTQQEFLNDIDSVTYRYALGGNQSGKSQLGARETSWVFTNSHPFFKRPERWGDGPIQIILMGRTLTQVEDTLWRKIKALIPEGSYKEVKQGNSIKKVIHNETGNVILFMSHHGVDEAADKAQSFEAHYVWIDEMPKKYRIVEELHRRVMANQGRFIATFTPKTVNMEIRKLVDKSSKPHSAKYQLLTFDNPRYTEKDKEMMLESLKTASASYRKMVLTGSWMSSEDSVYEFTDAMIEMPSMYSPYWRHVESVDPAVKSKAGYTLWAEDPKTGVWYCVKAEYLEAVFDPNELYHKIMELSSGHNIVRRVCDPHEGWYLGIASANKTSPGYVTPYSKNNRKADLIKGLQEKLGNRLIISPTCDKMITEFEECRWSDKGTDKIVNSSKFHLLDSAQYFADMMPKYEGTALPNTTWYQKIREDDIRIQKAKKAKTEKIKKQAMRITRARKSKNKRRKTKWERLLG